MGKITLIILAAFFANLSFAQNPEFERITNFNSGWKFKQGEVPGFMTPAYNDRSWRMLQLPHDWAIEGKYAESNPAGESGGYLPNGIGCYRKSFQIPETMKGNASQSVSTGFT
jgi:beta-galactosidase